MLRKWMPHVAILLSNMYLVFFLLDRVNTAMAFINNGLTKALLLVLALISIFNACLLIGDHRRAVRAAQRRKAMPRERFQAESPAQPVRRAEAQRNTAPRPSAPRSAQNSYPRYGSTPTANSRPAQRPKY